MEGNNMYFYENHLGGIYYSNEDLDWDMLYCEEFGDSDWLIGYFETADEAKEYLIDPEEMDEKTIEYYTSVIDEAFS
ncbi:MAG: hypothetical protein MJ246_03375 [Clostridia bacterium]|nr:hypothetical protein [Clostridia bacterium]